MKIGMFVNYYTPSKGGTEASVVNLCNGLENAGHKTFVFAPKYPNWKDAKNNIFRYKSVYFNYNDYFYVIPLPFVVRAHARETVRKLNLDVIHSHQPYSLGKEALRFSKEFSIPLVFTHHIRYEDYTHYVPFVPEFLMRKYLKKSVVEYCNQCDCVIAPSMSIKKMLSEYKISTPIEIIPSGIDVEKFKKDKEKRKEIRRKYEIEENDVVFITASRITKEKNIRFLVKSFFEIKKSLAGIKFFIIGDGAAKKNLEKITKNLNLERDIIFTGFVHKDRMPDFYQASDIFLFSSLTETQGLVIAEAMASGLLTVAIRSSGVEDMINNGKDGFLTSNSVKEFSETILKIVKDKELIRKISNRARISSKKFSITLWTDKMIKLYQSLI